MVTMDGSTLRFNPSGELTIYQVEESLKELNGALREAKEILIDLSVTDKIDTAGFQLIVSLGKSAQASGKGCRIDGIGGSVENFTTLFGYPFDSATKDKE
jgi:anti-anti-sigma regulatory factor